MNDKAGAVVQPRPFCILAVYDDPAWVAEMMGHVVEVVCRSGERALSDIDLDYVLLWEHRAGKNGPLLSPAMFRVSCWTPTGGSQASSGTTASK